MRTPNLIPKDTLRKATKSIVNRKPKDCSPETPNKHAKVTSVEDGRLLLKSSTSATVNTVSDGNKSEATIRRNVRFELDENPKFNPERHCKKGYEINRELEPERIQQPKIPSETETNAKPLTLRARKNGPFSP
jgi:hypothetical protein